MAFRVPESALLNSQYRELWAKINNLKVRSKDIHKGKTHIPIGTRRPYYEYPPDQEIPHKEIVYLTLDTIAPNNATSILMIGMSGTQKTTLIKTITYYNQFIANTRIGVMDCKGNSFDWSKCNVAKKNPGMLYPDEPGIMNIRAGCPLFATRGMPDADRKKVNLLNLDPNLLADMNVLIGLGFSPIARQHIFRMMTDKIPPEEILQEAERLYAKKKLTKQSHDNITLLVDNMIRAGFLTNKNFFNPNEVWDSGQSWALGFNNKEIPFLSVYIDKILRTIFDRANSGVGKKERYWLVVDDCQKAFGLDPKIYPSVQTGIDVLTQWRFLGVNMILGVQSPTMLDQEMYSDIKHFFVYRCGNTEHLMKYIPNRNIIDRIKMLRFEPERHLSECMHIFPDRQRYQTFFPFNSPVAN